MSAGWAHTHLHGVGETLEAADTVVRHADGTQLARVVVSLQHGPLLLDVHTVGLRAAVFAGDAHTCEGAPREINQTTVWVGNHLPWSWPARQPGSPPSSSPPHPSSPTSPTPPTTCPPPAHHLPTTWREVQKQQVEVGCVQLRPPHLEGSAEAAGRGRVCPAAPGPPPPLAPSPQRSARATRSGPPRRSCRRRSSSQRVCVHTHAPPQAAFSLPQVTASATAGASEVEVWGERVMSGGCAPRDLGGDEQRLARHGGDGLAHSHLQCRALGFGGVQKGVGGFRRGALCAA
jgi:hypothetical protein